MIGGTEAPDEDRIERISRLAPELLMLMLRAQAPTAGVRQWQALGQRDEQTTELDARWLDCSPEPEAPRQRRWLVTVALPQHSGDTDLGALVLRDGDQTLRLAPSPIDPALCPPEEFIAKCRAEFGRATRARLQAFLAAVPSAHGVALSPALAECLASAREQLRDPLPSTAIAPGPLSARLEAVTALDEHGFWLTGWIHDAAPSEVKLIAIAPEGTRAEVTPGAVTFHPRPAYSKGLGDDEHVSTLGFHAYVQLAHPSRHPHGWVLEFHPASGEAVESALPDAVLTDAAPLWEHLSAQLNVEPQDEAVLEHQVLPTITGMRGGSHVAHVDRIFDFGDIPTSPEVSIVVSVRGIDRIQHQLVAFACDPSIGDAELIFVIPKADHTPLAEILDELHELYGVPFRLAQLSHHARRPRGLNLGAWLARGRYLLLMGGDQLPAEPGWIEALRMIYDSSPAIAALGPKLLYEDGSIAHAGAEYVPRVMPGQWERKLPLAGLARGVSPAASPRRVQAVSDACMLIEAERFNACGGFSELYLIGGDEAGDLCLKLAAGGGETWYVPAAEVYHLDRPEAPGRPTPAETRFNDWLFARRWAPRLAKNVAAKPAIAAPARRPTKPAHVSFDSGSGRAGPRIEALELVPDEPASSRTVQAAVVVPRVDSSRAPYENTYAFALEGWAIPPDGDTLTIEVREGGATVCQTEVDRTASNVAGRYSEAPGDYAAGFQFVLSSLTLPLEFELEVDAVDAGGTRAAIGRIRGRRRPLRSGYEPVLQPLLVTSIGRTGSTWLVTLLSRHPQIVGYRPFQYEAMLMSYWMELLQTLSEPASYMQAVLPELYDGDWWLGRGRHSPLPLRKADTEMPRWLGRENVEVLAGFCQSRLDAFYSEVARVEGQGVPRYFIEKSVPGATPRTLGELYPDGRELVLVRDLRDRVCSILDFNAKRGFELWGRDKVQSDEEWFSHLREEAMTLLDNLRQRSERAQLVRYEELIAAPQETLGRIFSYLGVDAADGTIERVLDEAGQLMPHAQAEHRTSETFESSVGRWRQQLSPERQAACADAFDDILVEFGYEPTDGGGDAPGTADASVAARS